MATILSRPLYQPFINAVRASGNETQQAIRLAESGDSKAAFLKTAEAMRAADLRDGPVRPEGNADHAVIAIAEVIGNAIRPFDPLRRSSLAVAADAPAATTRAHEAADLLADAQWAFNAQGGEYDVAKGVSLLTTARQLFREAEQAVPYHRTG